VPGAATRGEGGRFRPGRRSRFALLRYETDNIGDDIQSLAARRFLPRVDHLVDREALDAFDPPGRAPVKLVVNGWYAHRATSWPPTSPRLRPLVVSLHVNLADDAVAARFAGPESLAFLNSVGPVGARDTATEAFLVERGVPAYFSGCLTLTLAPDPRVAPADYVLAVGVSDEVTGLLSSRTDREVIALSPFVLPAPDLSPERRFARAAAVLACYQAAHCVVTTRLHAALPCLALGTPVLLLEDGGDGYYGTASRRPGKYAGLAELVRHGPVAALADGGTRFDLEHPPSNPEDHRALAAALARRVAAFTGQEALGPPAGPAPPPPADAAAARAMAETVTAETRAFAAAFPG
jgi:hypothetical protein